MREIISKEKEKNKSKECVTKKRMRAGCEWTTCSMAYLYIVSIKDYKHIDKYTESIV